MIPLQEGDSVHVKTFNADGKVVKTAERPRSYVVDTPRGVILRNRRHLVKLNKEVQLSDPLTFSRWYVCKKAKRRVIQKIRMIQRLQNLILSRPTLLVMNKVLA